MLARRGRFAVSSLLLFAVLGGAAALESGATDPCPSGKVCLLTTGFSTRKGVLRVELQLVNRSGRTVYYRGYEKGDPIQDRELVLVDRWKDAGDLHCYTGVGLRSLKEDGWVRWREQVVDPTYLSRYGVRVGKNPARRGSMIWSKPIIMPRSRLLAATLAASEASAAGQVAEMTATIRNVSDVSSVTLHPGNARWIAECYHDARLLRRMHTSLEEPAEEEAETEAEGDAPLGPGSDVRWFHKVTLGETGGQGGTCYLYFDYCDFDGDDGHMSGLNGCTSAAIARVPVGTQKEDRVSRRTTSSTTPSSAESLPPHPAIESVHP